MPALHHPIEYALVLAFVLAFGATTTSTVLADPAPAAPAPASTNGASGDAAMPPGVNLVGNPSFESGLAGWVIALPDQSKNRNCQLTVSTDSPHSGTSCALLQVDDFVRFGVSPVGVRAAPGDHLHISFWVRFGPTDVLDPRSAGFCLRLLLKTSGEVSTGDLYIGLDGQVKRAQGPMVFAGPLPTDWTQVQADVVIPDDAVVASPNFFVWHVEGPVYLDDVSITKN